jgi:hypothetical protein
MDELYPIMNSSFNTAAEIYIHVSILVAIGIILSICWQKDNARVYYMRRKNTDENPVINI